MDYEFNGLPLHVLLVHFVVVVVPVAALCTVLAAAWPAARRRLGIVTPIIALGALISVPITTQAGEWLQARVGHTELVAAHAALGTTLLPWAVATFLLAAIQWFWFRFVTAPDAKFASRVPGKSARLVITLVLAAAVAVLAVGSVLTVVQIGESGVRAIWTGSFTQNPK
jgi:hypothetical protein